MELQERKQIPSGKGNIMSKIESAFRLAEDYHGMGKWCSELAEILFVNGWLADKNSVDCRVSELAEEYDDRREAGDCEDYTLVHFVAELETMNLLDDGQD